MKYLASIYCLLVWFTHCIRCFANLDQAVNASFTHRLLQFHHRKPSPHLRGGGGHAVQARVAQIMKALSIYKGKLSPEDLQILHDRYLPNSTASLTPEEVASIVEKYVTDHEHDSHRNWCSTLECCKMESESCSVSDLKRDEITLILPGGHTHCLFSTSSDFAFQVIPGVADKLLLYFQGGGACWDESSTMGNMCHRDINPELFLRNFRGSQLSTNLKEYTSVAVLYCSGDLHFGNVTRPYTDSAGIPVRQTGYYNARAVLDWIVQQQRDGHIASSISELLIMGTSAGSLGIQVWSKTILSELKWERAAVLPDSYVGAFPRGSVPDLFKNYNFCGLPILTENLRQTCEQGQLEIPPMVVELASAYPNVPYAFIQSKADITQQKFYEAVGNFGNYDDAIISPAEFYIRVNEMFDYYSQHMDNFVVFLLNGVLHGWLTGIASSDISAGKVMRLFEWITALPLQPGQTIVSNCEGSIRTSDDIFDINTRILRDVNILQQQHCRFGEGCAHWSLRVNKLTTEEIHERSRALAEESDDLTFCLKSVMDTSFTAAAD